MSDINLLLFGATGMIGEGVLRFLLNSGQVSSVTAVSRRPLSFRHEKLIGIVEGDLEHLSQVGLLKDFDVYLYCIGVSAVGTSEEDYRRQTYLLLRRIAEQIAAQNPRMTFEFVSSVGADPGSKQMWCRVKGEAEQAVLGFGFYDAYVLRPGFIQPMRGAEPHQTASKVIYDLTRRVYPLLSRLIPSFVTSTDELAAAMLLLGIKGNPQKIVPMAQIACLSRKKFGPNMSSGNATSIF